MNLLGVEFRESLNIRVPVVVMRLRNKVAVQLTDLVPQLRLFLRVIVFIIRAHSAPVEDILHRLRLRLTLGTKSRQSRQKLHFVLSQLQTGILSSNKVDVLINS